MKMNNRARIIPAMISGHIEWRHHLPNSRPILTPKEMDWELRERWRTGVEVHGQKLLISQSINWNMIKNHWFHLYIFNIYIIYIQYIYYIFQFYCAVENLLYFQTSPPFCSVQAEQLVAENGKVTQNKGRPPARRVGGGGCWWGRLVGVGAVSTGNVGK